MAWTYWGRIRENTERYMEYLRRKYDISEEETEELYEEVKNIMKHFEDERMFIWLIGVVLIAIGGIIVPIVYEIFRKKIWESRLESFEEVVILSKYRCRDCSITFLF